ncbi:MAG: transposase [Chloroflexi bacterium]|nr:transposase [Chloroflexota bacterium]
MLQRRSICLKDYDYSQEGAYFVTICMQDKVCVLGEVVNGEMQLNKYGQVVDGCWLEIPRHFQDIGIDAFVVMPNHVHGIAMIIDKCRGTACRAPTEKFGHPTPKSLPTIIRSFKSAVTNRINALRGTPGAPFWQRNYYEHVIRNETDFNDIRQYILDNPIKWDMDEENPNSQIGKPTCVNIVGARHAVPLQRR